MTIQDACVTVVQYVRDTGKPLADAVKAVWSQLEFSGEDTQTLLQEAIASRTNPMLNNPLRYAAASHSASGGAVGAKMTPYNHPVMERHEVTCQLLHDTIYNVNGVSKPVALFTGYDVITKLDSVRLVEAGVVRHRKMWEYIHERLTKCKKSRVEDLGEGEQMKIARMLYDLRQSKDPLPAKLT